MKLGRLRKEEVECDRTQRGKLAPQHKNYMAWVLALQQIGDILGVSRQRAHQLVNA